jgi:hypothetical protein
MEVMPNGTRLSRDAHKANGTRKHFPHNKSEDRHFPERFRNDRRSATLTIITGSDARSGVGG